MFRIAGGFSPRPPAPCWCVCFRPAGLPARQKVVLRRVHRASLCSRFPYPGPLARRPSRGERGRVLHSHAHPEPGHPAGPDRLRRHRLRRHRHRQDRGVSPPVLERLAGKTGTRALVLAPTRELALQIAQAVDLLGREAGCAPRWSSAAWRRGPAPGAPRAPADPHRHARPTGRSPRLGTARLDDIEILVLDEADRMLDMGFAPQLRRVMARLPAKRQSLLFSATMAGEVAEFARKHLRSPVRVEVARSGTVAAAGGAARLPRGAEREERAAAVAPRRLRRQHPGLRPHPPPARTRSPASSSGRATGSTASTPTARSPSASARWRASAAGRCACWSPPTSPRAGSTSRTSATSSTTTSRMSPRTTFTASAGPPAPPPAGVPRASSLRTRAPLLQAIERLMRTRVPEGRVPRDEPGFRAAIESGESRQRDPGPRQRGHGVSSRPAGQAPGRHARSHGSGAVFSGRPSRNGPSRRPAAASRWS